MDVTHDEAVNQLKYHKRMALVVRDVGKVPHSCASNETEPWDAYSTGETRFVSRPYSAAHELAARHQVVRNFRY